MIRLCLILLTTHLLCPPSRAEDGYRLWLRYDLVQDASLRQAYAATFRGWAVAGDSPTLSAARQELRTGLEGLLGNAVPEWKDATTDGLLLAGTPAAAPLIRSLDTENRLAKTGAEGFTIFSAESDGKRLTVITAHSDIGVLYGVFHFLRLLQTHQPPGRLPVTTQPQIQLRLLDHWDNLDRTVERGYAGSSIWDWHRLPDYLPQRYTDYARANASIGINGTVLTNVNANALVLRADYLEKVQALAGVFRPYGIKVYLTARFSAPMELGGLPTADPLDPAVQQWWNAKVAEIYRLVPDFGGFLVKANSEGQPGPQNYGRSHADGANMLAGALAPFGGVVMWRAFVYSNEVPEDRAKQAYNEFVPLDGRFRKNVLVQVKNGPIDFQPREPAHPMFGAMPQTPLMLEFQITQEYLGQGTQLVFLAPLYKETLDFDTYAKGSGSTVAQIIAGRLDQHALSGIAGVSNIGADRNWTGHPFGQANWYAFGRLAWAPDLSAAAIAEEWLRQTFTNEQPVLDTLKALMLESRDICVDYMTPLGLHHLMATGHHYGPGPWIDDLPRADWNPVYFHKADTSGIGFDRSPGGSNAVSQYFSPVRERFTGREQCPEEYLLWFHHVPWTARLPSGQTLWEALCRKYDAGVAGVARMHARWRAVAGKIDAERFHDVDMLLGIQEKEARWWRDACLQYFQSVSGLPFPEQIKAPEKPLGDYKKLSFPYAPGIRPGW